MAYILTLFLGFCGFLPRCMEAIFSLLTRHHFKSFFCCLLIIIFCYSVVNNDIIADSVKVDKYFSQIRMLTDNNFDNSELIAASTKAKYSVRIEGDNFSPITISAYGTKAGEVFKSSLNKGNQFKSDKI